MEVIQSAANIAQFQGSHCLNIFTNGKSIFWVGCDCQSPSWFMQDPQVIHRLKIYRFDVLTKTCSLVMQWVPGTQCKYWCFQIAYFMDPKNCFLLMVQYQRAVRVHMIHFPQHQPTPIPMESVGSPWLRGSSVTAFIDGSQFYVGFCKKSRPNVCTVYTIAIYPHTYKVTWSLFVDNRFALVPILSPLYHKGWNINEIYGKSARRWAWQIESTSSVKSDYWPLVMFKSSLWTVALGGLYLRVPPPRTSPRRVQSLLPFVDESVECTICYHLPTNANELLDNKKWVRPCKCLGYCHQECLDRWALYAHTKNYDWRFDMHMWLETWSNHSEGFQCPNCHHIYSHICTIGPLRPMHQIIQATKDLPGCGLFCAYQIALVVLLLFTLLQAKYPVIQSLAMTFKKAADAYYLNVIRSFGQPHWILHDAIRFIDVGLLLYAIMDQIEFVFPLWCLLVLMTIPVPYQVALLVIAEIVLLAPHLLAIHRVRFVDYDTATHKAKTRPITRSQSLTSLHICQ